MNTLSFRATEDYGLSIELLIDGQPLAKLSPDDPDTKIPYYYFEGDLPLGYWGKDDTSIKLLAFVFAGNLDAAALNVESCVKAKRLYFVILVVVLILATQRKMIEKNSELLQTITIQ